jgi:hypothetical protein
VSHPILPPLPLDEWRETKTTLHLFTQIVGKVRMALSAEMNHWWHVPLYVSVRGLTTGPIVDAGRALELELDFVDHVLSIRASDAGDERIPLEGISVAEFYRRVMAALDRMGIHPRFVARPFDPSRVGSDIPLAEDTTHATYDPEYAGRFWHILIEVECVFRTFRGRFVGKCSPVHFFWHSFDLAVTRFSGRAVELPEDADPVTREAYSHEVISAGFWVGDDDVREPAFYTYVAPEPPGLAAEPLRPAAAVWQDAGGSSMALYRYEDFRTADDPTGSLLAFLQSAYDAGARRAAWPRGDLERGEHRA